MKFSNPIENFTIKPRELGGSISQYYGEGRGLYTLTIAHSGIDVVAYYGCPINAICDGKVVEIDLEGTSGYGNAVRVLTDTHQIIYGHLSEINVFLNQQIKTGDLIGKMGNSGFVVSDQSNVFFHGNKTDSIHPGTHLHITVSEVTEPINGTPIFTFQNGDRRRILNYDNGYLGAIDPLPFFTKFSHDFETDISYGNNSDEVKALQTALAELGYFNHEVTGLFGDITRWANFDFQERFVGLNIFQLLYRGKYCSVKTRGRLNNLFNSQK